MLSKLNKNLIASAVAIEEEAAKEAGMIGYMARAMVQASLPHSRPATNEFTRKNGNFTLTILCPSKIGLPYGTVPRLLLAWITTEAVKTQTKTLVLGDTLADFMRELELGDGTGGKTGSITRLRNQMRKLFSSTISCDYHDNQRDAGAGFRIATSYETWWTHQDPEQAGLWQSNVTLDEAFYKEIITSPVPVDLRALKALRRSPLALDLYNWLTYRNSYLKKDTLMRWDSLAMQLGSAYSRIRDFKAALLTELKKVQIVYPEANIGIEEKGLILKPSPTHIPR